MIYEAQILISVLDKVGSTKLVKIKENTGPSWKVLSKHFD